MTPKTTRLVAAFLAAFVLLSAAPRVPGLLASLTDPAVTDLLGDVLLGAALLLTLVAWWVLRHRQAPARPAGARVLCRDRDVRPRTGRRPTGLGRRLREAARKGERPTELARRFGLAQDAVRLALGPGPASPAAPTGKSFRPRQPSLPARPKASAVPVRQTPYRALA